MSVDQYADELIHLEALLESITSDFLPKASSFDKHIAGEIDEISYVTDFKLKCDLHLKELEIADDVRYRDVEALRESVTNLTEQTDNLVKQNFKLEAILKQLVKKFGERKDKLEEIKLLNRSYRSLTGIDFNTSNNKVMGYVERQIHPALNKVSVSSLILFGHKPTAFNLAARYDLTD